MVVKTGLHGRPFNVERLYQKIPNGNNDGQRYDNYFYYLKNKNKKITHKYR